MNDELAIEAKPVGYAALIDAYLLCHFHFGFIAIGSRHKIVQQDGWRILTPRHEPTATLEGHLTFALKYEGIDLAVLKRLFQAVDPSTITELVRAKPTGAYARRVWFLYEWLMGEQLDLPALDRGTYVQVVDPEIQWAGGWRQRTTSKGKKQSSRNASPLPDGVSD